MSDRAKAIALALKSDLPLIVKARETEACEAEAALKTAGRRFESVLSAENIRVGVMCSRSRLVGGLQKSIPWPSRSGDWQGDDSGGFVAWDIGEHLVDIGGPPPFDKMRSEEVGEAIGWLVSQVHAVIMISTVLDAVPNALAGFGGLRARTKKPCLFIVAGAASAGGSTEAGGALRPVIHRNFGLENVRVEVLEGSTVTCDELRNCVGDYLYTSRIPFRDLLIGDWVALEGPRCRQLMTRVLEMARRRLVKARAAKESLATSKEVLRSTLERAADGTGAIIRSTVERALAELDIDRRSEEIVAQADAYDGVCEGALAKALEKSLAGWRENVLDDAIEYERRSAIERWGTIDESVASDVRFAADVLAVVDSDSADTGLRESLKLTVATGWKCLRKSSEQVASMIVSSAKKQFLGYVAERKVGLPGRRKKGKENAASEQRGYNVPLTSQIRRAALGKVATGALVDFSASLRARGDEVGDGLAARLKSELSSQYLGLLQSSCSRVAEETDLWAVAEQDLSSRVDTLKAGT